MSSTKLSIVDNINADLAAAKADYAVAVGRAAAATAALPAEYRTLVKLEQSEPVWWTVAVLVVGLAVGCLVAVVAFPR